MNQLSSSPHVASRCKKLQSSASVSAAESREEQEEQRTGESRGATSSEQTSTRSSPHAPEQAFATGAESREDVTTWLPIVISSLDFNKLLSVTFKHQCLTYFALFTLFIKPQIQHEMEIVIIFLP